MTRHTSPPVRGVVEAVRGILMASRKPLTSPQLVDLLGGQFTRAQVTRAASNLCRYAGFRRSTVARLGRFCVAYERPAAGTVPVQEKAIVRPQSQCALQEVWR